MAAANAAAEQYAASMIDEMLGKAFGGRRRSPSRRSGISIEFKAGTPPHRRRLPEQGEVEETRRTMQCRVCEEVVAVYGFAIYCPNCGRMAPVQQFGELIRLHRDGLAALDSLPQEIKRGLAESGVLGANFENTIKDGFGALETFLRAWFKAEAPDIPLGNGNVFQRLDDAAELYRRHLEVDLLAVLGPEGWAHLNEVAAMRHVLVHNAGIVDARFPGPTANMAPEGWTAHPDQEVGRRRLHHLARTCGCDLRLVAREDETTAHASAANRMASLRRIDTSVTTVPEPLCRAECPARVRPHASDRWHSVSDRRGKSRPSGSR